MRPLVLVLSLAVIGSCGAARAADWWLVAEGEDGTRLYSDASSLSCQGGRCQVMERSMYLQARPDGTREVDDLSGYDCQGRSTATLSETAFDDAGKTPGRVDARTPRWQPVQSATVAEASMSFACSFLDQYSALRPADTLVVGERTFTRARGQGLAPPPAALAALTPAPARTAEPPARAPAGSGRGPSVQIAAVDSADAAQTVLSAFERNNAGLMTGHAGRVESAEVDGRRVWRAMVAGFASTDAARTFCEAVRGTGGDCFLRPAGGRGG